MKRNIKTVLLSSLIMLGAVNAFAADATVSFVKGKVEVLKGNEWVALKQGDELKKSDIVNTGFQSEAKIKLFDSVMYLGPVTRISLDELSTNQKTDKVSVYLKTGNVRSQVNHTESKRVNYQVQTAIAVASVRGTGFDMDDSNNIFVDTGIVAAAAVSSLTSVTSTDMAESVELPQDGVLLQANQTMEVSETNYTQTPVNQVVKAANDVVSTVAKASEKEAVSAATSVSSTDAASMAVAATPVVQVAAAPKAPETGNVIIKVSVEK